MSREAHVRFCERVRGKFLCPTHLKARYYDPKTGRFLQPDPIGYGDGLNMYKFAYNNPNSFRDPLGLWGDWGPTATGPGANGGWGNGWGNGYGYGNNHVGYDGGATYIGLDGWIRDSITGKPITQVQIDPQSGLPYGFRPPVGGNPYPPSNPPPTQLEGKVEMTDDENDPLMEPIKLDPKNKKPGIDEIINERPKPKYESESKLKIEDIPAFKYPEPIPEEWYKNPTLPIPVPSNPDNFFPGGTTRPGTA